jgi:phage tail tube protein FII
LKRAKKIEKAKGRWKIKEKARKKTSIQVSIRKEEDDEEKDDEVSAA